MSRIEKMSIQGIRSFSPEGSEKIDIFTPVTLILGPNGTGKTTIIECLKYATTGELPPGTKVGGCFVHDPKLAQEVEVKAKVGLSIKDVSGHNMIISRSLLATQKSKTIQLRTLDGVIKRQLASGEVNSISSKCAELDREMVSSLGVSKPVLESVIFCHQEESNWPLSEGKAVKQRFDDIFASTRYVKALETIRKTKMERDQNVKVQKASVAHLREQTMKASEVRADYDETKMRVAAEDHSLEKISEKLEPLKAELQTFRHKYQELCSVQADVETHEKEQKMLSEAIRKLRRNVKSNFEGSDADLRAVIENAADSLASMEERSSSFECRLTAWRKEVDRLQSSRNRLLIEKGKQEQERKNFEQQRLNLQEMTEEYSSAEGVAAVCSSETTVEEHAAFYRTLQERLRQSEAELAQRRRKFEERESVVQKDLDRQRSAISRLEESKKMKRQLQERQRRELRVVRTKLADAEGSVERLEAARAKLETAEAKRTAAEDADSAKVLKREIEADKRALAVRAEEMAAVEAQIAALMQKAAQVAEKGLVEREVKEKEQSGRRLRSKLADSLEQIFCGDVPKGRLRAAFDAKLRDLQEAVGRESEKLQRCRASLTKVDTELQLSRGQLETKRRRLRDVQEQLRAACGSASFQEVLRSCQEKKKSIEEEHSFIQGSVATYRKFKERLDKDHACPLCHRSFDTGAEVVELSEELETKLSLAPRELHSKERERKEVNTRYDSLMRLHALPEERQELERELQRLQEDVLEKEKSSEGLSTELETAKSVLELQQLDESVAKSIQGDVVVLERFETELRVATEKLQALTTAAGAEGGGASLEDLQKQKAEVKAAAQAIEESIEDKREAMDSAAEQLERLRANVNRLRDDCRALERLNADKVHLSNEAERLTADGERLEGEMTEEEGRFAPLRAAILALEKEKEELRAEKEEALETLRGRDGKLRLNLQQFGGVLSAVRKYVSDGKETRLTQLLRKVEETDASVTEKERSIADGEKETAQLKEDVANHKIRHRELQDCLEIREKETAAAQLERRLQELRAQVGGVRVTELKQNLQQREKEEEELSRQRFVLFEKKTKLVGQLKQLEKELASTIYRDAQKKFTSALHELKTTEIAASDLEKYYRALDRAIMTYHAFKMEEINKIVKELWRNTYQGNDIDYIEIRSDEDEAGVSRTRRTYNYRVVMVKSDTALDMRGRCSAGQKVLASLIIRLALAEAFCLNCGVLALDEPTTNLDRANIESLALALVEIIKTRSKQKNFQLIVITHDADFVELMGRSEFVEHFFRISRSPEGLSKIRKVRIDEEFH